jgi:type IV pilus assembly protein PilN
MKIEINLLPWREMRRKKESKQFAYSTIIGFILLGLTCLLANCLISRLSERQNNYNKGLKNEIAILNVQIHKINKIKEQKKILMERIFLFHNLQNSRLLKIHLFEELIKLMPEDVYLTLIRGTEKKITLEGFSESNYGVSQLMKNIEQNPWMQDPNLVEIKNMKRLAPNNRFILNFILKSKPIQNVNL